MNLGIGEEGRKAKFGQVCFVLIFEEHFVKRRGMRIEEIEFSSIV